MCVILYIHSFKPDNINVITELYSWAVFACFLLTCVVKHALGGVISVNLINMNVLGAEPLPQVWLGSNNDYWQDINCRLYLTVIVIVITIIFIYVCVCVCVCVTTYTPVLARVHNSYIVYDNVSRPTIGNIEFCILFF